MKTIQYIFHIAVVLTLASCFHDEGSEPTTCPTTGKVYVANTGANTISVIDSAEDVVCTTITVGSSPRIWRINRTSQRLYVNNRNSNTVSVIDTSTDSVIDTIQVGIDPSAVTEDITNSRLYVTNLGSDSLSVIDTSTNQVLATNGTVDLGTDSAPHKVKENESTNKIYVLHANTNVSIIDGNDLAQPPTVIPLGVTDDTPPLGRLIVKEGANRVFITRGNTIGGVSIIEANDNNNVFTLTVGAKPRRIRSYGDTVYVVNENGNSVSIFPVYADPGTVVTTFGVGTSPIDLRLNTTTNLLYVTNKGDDTVSVVDTANFNISVIATITVGDAPVNVIINKSLNKIYVSNRGANDDGTTVSVIDGSNHTVIKTISVGLRPGSMKIIE